MKTLDEIKTEVSYLATKIGAVEHCLPTYGQSKDLARPHIEVNPLGYHYVIVERGQERSRITTQDIDELLFRIFQHVTFEIACSYELENRIEAQDNRRMLFQRQIELLTRLFKHWGERRTKEVEHILKKYPFDDMAATRVDLSKKIGWTKACEKYPIPKGSG